MVREPASVNVSYRGLPIARGARLVPEGSGGYVEVDQPMPVGSEIVLYLAQPPAEAEDGRGLVVKVTRVVEGAGRAGAQVELLGRTDVVVAFPEGAVPEAVPVAATMPMSAASGAALAAALAGAGSGPVVVATQGSGPVVVPGSGPVMTSAPAPVPVPTPGSGPVVVSRQVEAAPPDAPVRRQSVVTSPPVSVIGGPKGDADGDDGKVVDLKSLEVEGDDGPGGTGGGPGGKKGKRKRRNTMIGR